MQIIKSGENTVLKSSKGTELKRVAIGIGWRATAVPHGQDHFDLDVSLALLDSSEKIQLQDDVVYYGSKTALGGTVFHSGDEEEGADEDEDDDQEVITIQDLSAVPNRYDRLNAAVSVHRAKLNGYHFGMIKNAYMRILDMDNNRTLVRYDLSGDFSDETCVLVGSIQRHLSGWNFNAMGQPIEDGFGGLVRMYGGVTSGRSA